MPKRPGRYEHETVVSLHRAIFRVALSADASDAGCHRPDHRAFIGYILLCGRISGGFA